MTKAGKQSLSIPTKLEVDGTDTAVRKEWIRAGYDFGEYRFGDNDNDECTQKGSILNNQTATSQHQT